MIDEGTVFYDFPFLKIIFRNENVTKTLKKAPCRNDVILNADIDRYLLSSTLSAWN